MKRWKLLLLGTAVTAWVPTLVWLFIGFPVLYAAEPPTPEAESWNESDSQPTPAEDPAGRGDRKSRREQRKFGRDVLTRATVSWNETRGESLSRREFARAAVAQGDARAAAEKAKKPFTTAAPHLAVLEDELAMHEDAEEMGYVNEAGEIDIDRFREILQVILEFLRMFMTFFASDAPAVDAPVVAILPPRRSAVASVLFLATAV